MSCLVRMIGTGHSSSRSPLSWMRIVRTCGPCSSRPRGWITAKPWLCRAGMQASCTAPRSAYFDLRCGFVAALIARAISAWARTNAACTLRLSVVAMSLGITLPSPCYAVATARHGPRATGSGSSATTGNGTRLPKACPSPCGDDGEAGRRSRALPANRSGAWPQSRLRVFHGVPTSDCPLLGVDRQAGDLARATTGEALGKLVEKLAHLGLMVRPDVPPELAIICDLAPVIGAQGHGPSAALGRAAILRCRLDRKSTRLNSSHVAISYAVYC